MSQKKKKQMDKGGVAIAIVLICLVVLVVAILAVSLVNKLGIVGRCTKAISGDTMSVNANELAYFEYQSMMQTYQNCQYEFMYYQYGLMEDTNNVQSTFGDASNYASYMISAYKSTGYYTADAVAQGKTILALCEAAKDAGIELDETEKKEIETNISSMKESATTGGSSLKNMIYSYVDKYISVNDIRKAMTKLSLASKYSTLKSTSIEDDHRTTFDKDKTAYSEYASENKTSTFIADYTKYTFNTTDKDLYAKLKEVKTYDELRTEIVKSIFESKYDTLYDSNIVKAEVEIPDGTDPAKVESDMLDAIITQLVTNNDEDPSEDNGNGDEVATSFEQVIENNKITILGAARTELAKVSSNTTVMAYADPETSTDEVAKWMFDAARAANDVKVVSTDAAKDGENNKVELYVLDAAAHIDERISRDYGYIKFAFGTGSTDDSEDTAKGKADAFLAAFNALSDKNAAAFQELYNGEAYSAITSKTYTEKAVDVTVDTAVKDWVFSATEGKCEVVKGSTGYFVVFLGKINLENWAEAAILGMTNDDYSVWSEKIVTDYNVTVSKKYQKMVDDYNESVETTAADTTAADTTEADTTAADTTAEETTVADTTAA